MNKEIKKSSYLILFVDDEDMARKYFEKGLKNNFNVLTVPNVVEAKKVIDKNSDNIAVVITDQRMPGDNGVVLLEYLRLNHPQIIRLLTTAYSDLSDAINSVNKGEIFRYIKKPWDFESLKTEIGQALDLFETRIERDNLLYEKMVAKKKMFKICRVKALILLARSLKFIRFSNSSTEDFIRKFVTIGNKNKKDDRRYFDLSNDDLSETMFMKNIFDKVLDILTPQSYSIEDSIDSQSLVNLFKELSGEFGIEISAKSLDLDKNIKVNNNLLSILFKTLFLEISGSIKDCINIDIQENDSKKGIVVNINTPKSIWLDQNNIFIISSGEKADSYINLLICYLSAGHLGGSVDFDKGDGENCDIKINLPYDPNEKEDFGEISSETIDDLTLLSVINDNHEF
jgi:two-component system probable response regulator PhcQ